MKLIYLLLALVLLTVSSCEKDEPIPATTSTTTTSSGSSDTTWWQMRIEGSWTLDFYRASPGGDTYENSINYDFNTSNNTVDVDNANYQGVTSTSTENYSIIDYLREYNTIDDTLYVEESGKLVIGLDTMIIEGIYRTDASGNSYPAGFFGPYSNDKLELLHLNYTDISSIPNGIYAWHFLRD